MKHTPEKPPRVANKDARKCVQQRKPFRGNNTFGICVDNRYVVYSYGAHWPMFVYDDGRWFANSDKYSRTTTKHYSQLHPLTDCTLLPLSGMCDLAGYGFLGTLTRRLIGEEAFANQQGGQGHGSHQARSRCAHRETQEQPRRSAGT